MLYENTFKFYFVIAELSDNLQSVFSVLKADNIISNLKKSLQYARVVE